MLKEPVSRAVSLVFLSVFSPANKRSRPLRARYNDWLWFSSVLPLNVCFRTLKHSLNRSSFDLTSISRNPLLLPDWPRGEKRERISACALRGGGGGGGASQINVRLLWLQSQVSAASPRSICHLWKGCILSRDVALPGQPETDGGVKSEWCSTRPQRSLFSYNTITLPVRRDKFEGI